VHGVADGLVFGVTLDIFNVNIWIASLRSQ
jgi:hypothetical protein